MTDTDPGTDSALETSADKQQSSVGQVAEVGALWALHANDQWTVAGCRDRTILGFWP